MRGSCREAAQEDLRPRLTVQFVTGDGTQEWPPGLDSSSVNSGSGVGSAAAASDADSASVSTAAGGVVEGDVQDSTAGGEAADGSSERQPEAGSQREDSRAAKPELDVASMASDGGAQSKPADGVDAVVGVNSTSDAADGQQQDGFGAPSGVLFSSTPAGRALMVAALLLFVFCLYIVRAALARRKARTGGARPSSSNRLNRFLARRRTAESDAAKP